MDNRGARGYHDNRGRGGGNWRDADRGGGGERNIRGNNGNRGYGRQNHRIRNPAEDQDQPPVVRTQRPVRTMGFNFITKMLKENDNQEIILRLSDDRGGFNSLLENKDMKDDIVVLVVQLINIICDSSFLENKISLLHVILNSVFMQKLVVYITNLINQSAHDVKFNRIFWNDTDAFWNGLNTFGKTVADLIPSNCEAVRGMLKTLTIFYPLIEIAHNIHISDEIKAQTASILDVVEHAIKDMEVQKKTKALDNQDEMEPPDDFREISIIPSALEVTNKKPGFLRANIIDKAYRDVNQYLDIQFRLLREDFVTPLRKGICTFLENLPKPKQEHKKLENIRIYPAVQFLSVETVNDCNCYKINFECDNKPGRINYERSKRFMYGSLVCFTRNNFRTLLFGKIVNRDIEKLKKGELVVGFHEEVPIDYTARYIMVESSVYFEPYYQVLGVLQRMDPAHFPMEKYIIRVETSSKPPDYLVKDPPVTYQIENNTVMPLMFPDIDVHNFNLSQKEAFKAALTDELSIIQGPPGTGKTYLGLKIAHTLLTNQHAWYRKTPILVICFTNHALDQFLEGLLSVTTNILRVGGQSKNETLKKYNLHQVRRSRHSPAVAQRFGEVRDHMWKLRTIQDTLSKIVDNDSIVHFSNFKEVIPDYERTWFATARRDEMIEWMMVGKLNQAPVVNPQGVQQQMGNLRIEDNVDVDDLIDQQDNEPEEDIFDNIHVKPFNALLTVKQLEDKLNLLQDKLAHVENLDELAGHLAQEKLNQEIWDTNTDLAHLQNQLRFFQDRRNRMNRPPRHTNLQRPQTMRHHDRWVLYFYWLDRYVEHLRTTYEKETDEFKKVFRLYNELKDVEDAHLMTNHLVVGMTTTGAARLQSSLQALKSPIVIVEEAAEVLEAHIIAALTSHCKHLILIGDHLQLKPGAADYRIETSYKLGISLFERMVRNNIKLHTLNVQHRMKPEICRLIKPHIYEVLHDHSSTNERNPILGMEKSLFFIDHQEPEQICQDNSKKNTHEARFLIALARHLILNGYKPEQITILAAYLGQFYEMMSEKRKPVNRMQLEQVRIAVLDNYQGEESDIVLLSLVRSNEDNKAGFLRIQNRVCVALSRARDGFYIIGNMTLLLRSDSENEIWENVKKVLDKGDSIGSHLTLRCQVHQNKLTEVSCGKDFIKLSEGGCDLLCEAPLKCGHVCKRLCHVMDRDHTTYKCNEKCTNVVCEDQRHVCPKKCYEDCGRCMYLVPKHLPCGHDANIACHLDPADYKCLASVATKLPCDHETLKPCHIDPEKFVCPLDCDTRVEPCGHKCTRRCHRKSDPDHLQYKCREACAQSRTGCRNEEPHICRRLCFQEHEECMEQIKKPRSCGHVNRMACMDDVEAVDCTKPCRNKLACGHGCKNECSEAHSICSKVVKKPIAKCGHTVDVKCHQTPDKSMCKSKTCPVPLPCGHKCTKMCKEPCNTRCKALVECNLYAPCGHSLKNVQCYLKNGADPKMLMANCTEPCKVTLECGHKCPGTCGLCKQGRIHVRCTQKCGVPLVCNHECPIPCRENCKPCTRKCEMKCRHNRCGKLCGEPCTPCNSPCERRCPHVRCTKKCGEICNVDPCNRRCTRELPCGHPCVGFCGDPCPKLCRVCNFEELTEIYFGTEDEEDAIFVLLNDCKHVVEYSGLEQWLKQGENQIGYKTCPKCTTTITTTERYSDYVKMAVLDVIEAKKLSHGNAKDNNVVRSNLIRELSHMEVNRLFVGSSQFFKTMNILLSRLQPSKNERRQAINKIELNAIKSKIQTLNHIKQCFSEVKTPLVGVNLSVPQENLLLSVLMRSEDHVTNQEIEDLECEIKRLHRMVQFDQITSSEIFPAARTKSVVSLLQEELRNLLQSDERYTTRLDERIKPKLQAFAKEVDSVISISDKERIEIVRAIGLQKGHWYKCPNGHPYAIGECGGAMQIARCFCGAEIGGQGHRLLSTNQHAGEMDDSTRHAWPGGLH